MRNNAEAVTVSLDAAGVATYTSPTIVIEHCYGYSIHGKWTKVGGTLGGTFKTYKSNDGIYWIEVGTTNIADASGAKEYEVADAMYRYVKHVCVLTGGSATLFVNSFVKGV